MVPHPSADNVLDQNIAIYYHLYLMKKVFISFSLGLLRIGLGLAALLAGLISSGRLVAEPANYGLLTTQYTIPVTLSATDSTIYHMVGWLYSIGPLQGKTVQVVIHGGSYDHNYFNFPYQPWLYSYVDYLTAAGYAVLDVDRIGSGLSDHPTPEQVTIVSGAYTIHQIVQGLRIGSIAGCVFNKVILVGHSFGSGIALVETATYNDVDGVILSGFGSVLNLSNLSAALADLEEANLDPRFANLPNGYETTKPGTRGTLFYNAQDADPNVIALDECLKQTMTDGELNQLLSVFTTNTYSSQVKVPVLIANGSADKIASASGTDPVTLKNTEAPFFPLVPSLSTFILDNSGHNVNLHLNAPDWFAAARKWSDQFVGP